MCKLVEMKNKKYGPWTVICMTERPKGIKTHGAHWLCQCECGNKEVISGAKLRAGRMKRGCLVCSGRLHKKGGKGASPTYVSWRAMRERCLNKKSVAYHRYGGRGIKICNRWINSFPDFLKDMGERPTGTTLDRIDGNANYEPKNCRWADAKTQARNGTNFKLSDEKVVAILQLLKSGARQIDIATACGVSRSHIANIATGHSRS